jgi:hypothetical protein
MNTNYSLRILSSVALTLGLSGTFTLGAASAFAQDPNGQVPATQQTEPATGQRTDSQIEVDVVHALDAQQALQQDWITAATVQGEVTLSGTSASEANRQLAEATASKVPGVTKVVNSLKVGDPQQAADANGAGQQPEPAPQVAGNDNPPQPAPYPNADPNSAPQPGPQPGNQPNGQPGYGPTPRPSYRPAPYQPQVAQLPEPPREPVTIPQGSLIKVRTSESLDSKKAKPGTPVEYTVMRDVYVGGVLAIPRGATVLGQVTDVKKAGALGGSPELALTLQSLQLEGKAYDLAVEPFEVKGPNKAGRTVGNAIGGALFGAIIGGAVGGGEGAAIGAGAGAAGGTAASAATPGPRIWISAEAPMDFHLTAPITVMPVSRAEAQRLAANAPYPAPRPTLYRRGYPPPPPPPGYYYRPY